MHHITGNLSIIEKFLNFLSFYNKSPDLNRITETNKQNKRISKVGKISFMSNWILMYYKIQLVALIKFQTKSKDDEALRMAK